MTTPARIETTMTKKTMTAIARDAYCAPAQLQLRDMDVPAVGAGDVLVRVEAAGVDQGVWHLVTGLPYVVRAAGFGLRRPRNPVPGMDVAGRVAAVGADVTRFRPGDEVYGTCDGAYAEYARAHQDKLAPKPASLSFAQAATVPISACAALHGLRDAGRLTAGQRVLITGAGGGVGGYAVQIAKADGAHVTGVCRTAKTGLVRSLGADHVIDHTREDFTTGADRYDLILDTAGNRRLGRLRRVLTPRGALVIVGGPGGGRVLQGADRQIRAMLLSLFVGQRLTGLMSTESAADLETLTGLIDSGALTPALDRTYPLARTPDALAYLTTGQVAGKIAITI
ncbi:NAD(P)-dependent alcohol dehydrogenase [Nonomuraea ferruginea]|uniref:NAD(P)-dependent alcohol dehydrogenase n=1 Tax=Nonomuraea ferruginea TaxID=46174 RepID=A0ABT4T8R0_9ACTN|nr:NAD(P)-dependent alcohol dehydrogenase [Nonomuraea ferruginea]MDA0645835.1 NAD(P)-dependent alcohol dehydrogenase [Nonomuraea ferruginea]